MTDIPKTTQESVRYVDMTPGPDLPLRILRTYRANCDVLWADATDGALTENTLLAAMNDMQRQRAAILDRAIRVLELDAEMQQWERASLEDMRE